MEFKIADYNDVDGLQAKLCSAFQANDDAGFETGEGFNEQQYYDFYNGLEAPTVPIPRINGAYVEEIEHDGRRYESPSATAEAIRQGKPVLFFEVEY